MVAGLADGVCYGDELATRLATEGQKKARLAPWAGYRATRREPIDWKPVLRRQRLVAVVPVRGLITEGESRILATGGRVAGARSVAESLEVAREEPSVKAVVLHVDSRGGSPLASDLIWREVRRTAEKKPVVAFLDSVAASGGYYVAAGASRIVASPAVLTGSIGVIAALFDVSGLLEKVGVTREILARGENAALGTPSRAPTEGERAAMDRDLDEIYADFIARVAEGRGMDEAEVARRAEGRVYTGIRAEKVGLVDELGGFEDAVARALELAGIAPEVHTGLVVLETAGPALLPRLIRRMGLGRWPPAGSSTRTGASTSPGRWPRPGARRRCGRCGPCAAGGGRWRPWAGASWWPPPWRPSSSPPPASPRRARRRPSTPTPEPSTRAGSTGPTPSPRRPTGGR